MVKPHRAAVRPRVTVPASGETLWLEDVVQSEPVIGILGVAGTGSTTALSHIAALFPDRICVDGPVALIATESPVHGLTMNRIYRLSPWTIEDCYDYLKARWPARAKAVTARLATDPDFLRLEGNAELLTAVMDRLADDLDLVDVRAALLRAVSPSPEVLREAAIACFHGHPTAPRLVRHAVVRNILAAEHVIHALGDDLFVPFPLTDSFIELVDEIALGIARNPVGLSQIRYLSSHGRREIQPLCASIAYATKTGWRPDDRRPLTLTGAILDGADWPRIVMRGAMLENVRLRGANLVEAVLEAVNARGADFAGARLHRATLSGAKFDGADLSGASVLAAMADYVSFRGANLASARFDRAMLESCVFGKANLTNTSFVGADLRHANLIGAQIEGADFTDANLERAILTRLPMNRTRLRGARLALAMGIDADFEGIELPEASFEGGQLRGASFTHSVIRSGRFAGADLTGAKLAEIDWEGADLSCADLRGASFHLGTSRSGLIFSTTPGEGSRTGFYTDDFNDRAQAPEEIRKANLCGADLRGAFLGGVDFYLVDLRGAQLSPWQLPHLRHCGAILS